MIRHTLIAGCIALLATPGCSTAPPLANGRPSAESVASAVLDGLARRDRAALEALALSEREFKDHVWPELPAARPERNLPFSYVWGDLHQKSAIKLGETLEALGGQTLTLVRLRFSGETKYPSAVVHRDAIFTVRDASGAEKEVRACGSMLEKDGIWKVFSYVVDD